MSTTFLFKTLSSARWSAIKSVIQWLPCLVCAYALLVGAGGEKSSATIVGDEIRTKRIVLEDADGKPVGAWSGEGIRTNRILIDDADGKIVGSWRGNGLRANRIVLEDADGKEVGTWGPNANFGGSVELAIHAPWGKNANAFIKLRAFEGGSEVKLDGGSVGGDILMSAEKGASSVGFYSPCAECSSGFSLARMGVRSSQGYLHLYQDSIVDVDGEHGHGADTLFKVP